MTLSRDVQVVADGFPHIASARQDADSGAPAGDGGSRFDDDWVSSVADAAVRLWKYGAEAETVHALSGELYATPKGWVLLRVPNALVRGAFDALDEVGIELPADSQGRLNAHVSVMRPEETVGFGGVEKISERGHHFNYTLGPVRTAEKPGQKEYSRVWMIGISSPDLLQLRKSYGLGPPKYPFHLTIAVRRPSVLYDNGIRKVVAEPPRSLVRSSR